MKKLIALVLALVCVVGLVGCNTKSMNYIIENKPSVTGIVEEVHNDYVIMHSDTADGYPNGSRWSISMSAENKDSYTDLVIGDEIVVYHDGNVMETDPLKVGTVYAITLKTPADNKLIGTIEGTETGSNDTVLKEPPVLTVICGKESVEALRGTTSWMYQNEDGTGTGIKSDSMHPLQAKEYMTPLNLIPTTISSIDPLTANLQWDTTPDKVVVRCWGEECWGRYDVESEDILVDVMGIDFNSQLVTNYVIQLKDGNYIYEVVAKWNSSETWGGTAYYSFYTVKPDMELHPIEEVDDLCGYPLAPTE